MGYFKIKTSTELDECAIGHVIPESDFSTMTPKGKFVQLEYVENEDEITHYEVKPGIFTIKASMAGMYLEKTSFTRDRILDTFLTTKNITDKADCFFRNIHVYAEEGFEVAKRGILLYGPAGGGKSTALAVVAEKYTSDGKTAVVFWPTDKFEAWKVKDFIKTFKYIDGVEKLILIVEDVGGVEIDQVKMKSDSSLLALLDNQEKTFTISVLIIATTNFPEVFLGNLTNRPNRFDDKIEVGYPGAEYRLKLMEFFSKNRQLSDESKDLMQSDDTKEFTASHIRECLIRSRLHEKSLEETIKEIVNEIKTYKKAFQKGGSMGFHADDDD